MILAELWKSALGRLFLPHRRSRPGVPLGTIVTKNVTGCSGGMFSTYKYESSKQQKGAMRSAGARMETQYGGAELLKPLAIPTNGKRGPREK